MKSPNDKAALFAFLNTRKVYDQHYTHVSLDTPMGKFNLSKMEELYDSYLPHIWLYPDGPRPSLAETPGMEMPVLVDIDLKKKRSELEAEEQQEQEAAAADASTSSSSSRRRKRSLYTRAQVEKTIEIYRKALREICQDLDDEALTCVLLEKPPYEVQTGNEVYVKNGFHLHFPKLFLSKMAISLYLLPRVKVAVNALFHRICAEALDTKASAAYWLMLGSAKSSTSKPYAVSRVYDHLGAVVELEDAFGDFMLKVHMEQEYYSCVGNVAYLMPRILSTSIYGKQDDYYYEVFPELARTPLIDRFVHVVRPSSDFEKLSTTANLALATRLLGMMKTSTADDYGDWRNVGMALFNVSGRSAEGYRLWYDFSARSVKFNALEVAYLWHSTFVKSDYTMGTLHFFAKRDDPIAFNLYTSEKNVTIVDGERRDAQTMTNMDIARLLHNEYGDEFVCTKLSNPSRWFQFKDHRWQETEGGNELRKRISDENAVVVTTLNAAYDELLANRQFVPDFHQKCTNMKKNIQRCLSRGYKDNVLRECCELFYDKDFIEKLNKNKYLIGFTNGVYDFEEKRFRPGRPEDYLRTIIRYDYVDYGSERSREVIEVDQFFDRVFPDQDIKRYFLNYLCKVFVGGNEEKLIMFWTGAGNNGKTVTQTFIEKALDRLAIKFPTGMITGKKTAVGSACPELVRGGNGVRWAVMDEPDPSETINCGTLKCMTGNDTYWARDLFQGAAETTEITPMFKLNMICNKLPNINHPDAATWSRVRVVPFQSTFLPEAECPASVPEQFRLKKFPMDRRIADNLGEMRQALVYYMISRYNRIGDIDQTEPRDVLVATEKYQRESDIYSQFVAECMVSTVPEDRETAGIGDVSAVFKQWMNAEYPHMPSVTRTHMKEQLNAKLGACTNRGWPNRRVGLYCVEEEEEEMDVD